MSVKEIDINGYEPYREGKHAVFTSSENNCKHIAHNNCGHYVRQFKIDGKVISKTDTTTERCDYLLVNDTRKDAYYIELKGSDLIKAIQQVEKSIMMFRASLPDYKVFMRIIYHSGTHQMQNSDVLNWKKKHIKDAVIKERKYEEAIS